MAGNTFIVATSSKYSERAREVLFAIHSLFFLGGKGWIRRNSAPAVLGLRAYGNRLHVGVAFLENICSIVTGDLASLRDCELSVGDGGHDGLAAKN